MRFVRKIKNVFQSLKAKTLSEIGDIHPTETILLFNDDGTPYGVCGTVYATQVDKSRQLEYKKEKLIDFKD